MDGSNSVAIDLRNCERAGGSGSDNYLRIFMGEVRELDISPFTAANLWTAGRPQEWGRIRQILEPVLSPEFAVTCVVTQAFVDRVRHLLDGSMCPDDRSGIVMMIVNSRTRGDCDVLKMVLEVGADPDLPSEGWRASHTCGCWARVDVAAAIFACRPDMNALNGNGQTPSQAARSIYKGDDERPESAVFRPEVVKIIVDGGYEKGEFPLLAELACRQHWFAVRNVMRRQVVPKSEYMAKFCGKSAAEWAIYYKLEKLAQEIEYYGGLTTAELMEGRKKVEALRREAAEEKKKAQQAAADLSTTKEIVDSLTKELAEQKKEVEIMRAQLEIATTSNTKLRKKVADEQEKVESLTAERDALRRVKSKSWRNSKRHSPCRSRRK